MRAPRVHPIVIAAGGTGGHFFPAEALAQSLLARGHRIALLTDARSAGLRSPTFEDRHVIRGAGIAGRGMLRGASALMSLAVGTVQARRILARLAPSVVVGFGGYPSVAPVLAGRTLHQRPAVILHEQNAVLGRANRFLAQRANLLALSFEHTARLPEGVVTRVTGNPVRAAIEAATYRPPTDTLNVLVLGGSLGARVFSDVVPTAIAELPDEMRARIRISQQCRPEDLARVRTAYDAAGIAAELSDFFKDVGERLSRAHLVIARAGASTVAEVAASGRPSILVPLPGAIDDHQSANARAICEAGGAWVLPQATLSPQILCFQLSSLLSDPDALNRAAAAALSTARPDAADRLADIVDEFAEQRVCA